MSTDLPRVRALRGATTVARDEPEAIVEATGELLGRMLETNEVEHDDLISIIFTVTPDLSAEFPAAAARDLGLSDIPLLCATEIPVRGAIPMCIRVLLHLYTTRDYASLRHVYLGGARRLRTDLTEE